jgi:bacterioferritin-associated ferredoxin
MYVCICNAISERHVQKALETPPEKTTPGQIYKASAKIAGCGDNCKYQCGKCSCDFTRIAAEHNADKAMQKIKDKMDTAHPKHETESLFV